MIDWRVQINDQDPPGWDRHHDGCWFPDFGYQEYLLPFFDVGDSPIDPYGDTKFNEADVRRLKEHLRWSHSFFESKPDSWTITESSNGPINIIKLEREKLLAVIDKTLEIIEFALANGGTLIFLGD